ncbi:MAG: hypothetical protein COA39_011590 [Sulfurimonas sp.]|nr:hypothetical protein [Sulfurimonas sp.]
MECKVNVSEHSVIAESLDDDDLEIFNEFYESVDPKYLGLHQEQQFENNVYTTVLKSHYYIGYKWLNKNDYIHVSAKKDHNDKEADYLNMFVTCLDDPIVSQKLDKAYQIDFDDRWINIKENEDEITPLIVLHFLKIVKKLSQKGLKKGYIKVTENLTSKIKGKILINQTIRHNHFKNRLDKTICNYQIFTVNCLENMIIKTALMQCSRHLSGIDNEDIFKLLRQNINAFESVDTKEVFANDFSKIKYSPFYKEYSEALKLAKMIFKRFGFTLNSSTEEYVLRIPPFHINMPELFERYVEVKLNLAGIKTIDGNKENVSNWSMQPDFIVPGKGIIIDAKYKYWFHSDNHENSNYKADYMQLSLYGRDKKTRKIIGLEESNEEAALVFIYPSIDGNKKIDLTSCESSEKFNNISKIPLYIPVIKENK